MCPIKKNRSVAKRSPKKRMLEILIKTNYLLSLLVCFKTPKSETPTPDRVQIIKNTLPSV